MVVTDDFVIESWDMKSAVLELNRFRTPQSEEASCEFILGVIQA